MVTKSIEDSVGGHYESTIVLQDMDGAVTVIGQTIEGHKDKLKELGLSEDQIAEVEDSYNNYSMTIGNSMAEVLTTFTSGQAVTAELANANYHRQQCS